MLLEPSLPFSFLSFIFVLFMNNFKIMECLCFGLYVFNFIPVKFVEAFIIFILFLSFVASIHCLFVDYLSFVCFL